MKKNWLLVLVLVFALVLPGSVPAFAWDKIVSFGDSLSDDGLGRHNNFPDLISLFPEGELIGRASDGPVWLDHLANSMRNVELEGRAISGAKTNGDLLPYGDIGVLAQIERYIASLSNEYDGNDPDLSSTLFTIWIGGNDLLWSPTGPTQEVIEQAVDNIHTAIQQLVDAGAEDILVMNLPNIGAAPLIVNTGDSSLIAAYTGAAEAFNALLTERVCILRDLNEDIKFYMADTFRLLNFAIENADKLGFEEVYTTCMITIDPETGERAPNPDRENCDTALFWDEFHPTTLTHEYLAALALGQVKHGRITKEMKRKLKKLNPIQPRKPFVIHCYDLEDALED